MQRDRIKLKIGVIAIVILITIAMVAVGYRLLFWVDSYPPYSLEQVLRNTKKLNNQPLVRKLFDLGTKVRGIKDKKPGAIKGEPQRDNLVFLTKICKDSCRAIRCRIDPGLGHACRINCPKKTVRFCSIAVKALPEEVKK